MNTQLLCLFTLKDELDISIKFVLDNYDLTNPNVFILENKSKGWVTNGRNNEFYQYLIDRKNGSPTHSTILNSFNNLVYGNGLSVKNVERNLSDFTKFKTILSNKDLRRIIADFNLFGEASMQIVRTKGSDISAVYHLPKELVVPSIENEEGDCIDSCGGYDCRDYALSEGRDALKELTQVTRDFEEDRADCFT